MVWLVQSQLSFFEKNFIVLGIDNNQRKKLFGKIADTTWVKQNLKNENNYHHYNLDICNYQNLKKFLKNLKKLNL